MKLKKSSLSARMLEFNPNNIFMVVETKIVEACKDVAENKKNLKFGFMYLISELSDDGGFSIHLDVTMDHFDKNYKFENVSIITILYLF